MEGEEGEEDGGRGRGGGWRERRGMEGEEGEEEGATEKDY